MILDPTYGFNVVNMVTRDDCQDFAGIYANLNGDILHNPSKSQVKKLLVAHPERPLVLSGHGTPCGLLNKDWNGYVVGSELVQFLRKQQCIIGVFCYAGNFADTYGLHGFFTSMFISNVSESVDEGYPANSEIIQRENTEFSKRLNNLILNEPNMALWASKLQEYGLNHKEPFVRFNYEAMAFYEKENR